jgi:hypothetical protein
MMRRARAWVPGNRRREVHFEGEGEGGEVSVCNSRLKQHAGAAGWSSRLEQQAGAAGWSSRLEQQAGAGAGAGAGRSSWLEQQADRARLPCPCRRAAFKAVNFETGAMEEATDGEKAQVLAAIRLQPEQVGGRAGGRARVGVALLTQAPQGPRPSQHPLAPMAPSPLPPPPPPPHPPTHPHTPHLAPWSSLAGHPPPGIRGHLRCLHGEGQGGPRFRPRPPARGDSAGGHGRRGGAGGGHAQRR